MRVFLSLVLLTVAATTGTTSALRHPLEHYEEKFRAWVKAYKVHIGEGHEWRHRLHVFADNDDYIHNHNHRVNPLSTSETYQLGHNEYSHLTLDEFHARFQLGKYARQSGKSLLYTSHASSRSQEQQQEQQQARLRSSLPSFSLSTALPPALLGLPEEVDWVKEGVVTPVKNQGMCGSCWAFSTTGALEGAYALKTGKLLSFSEQELVDCDGNDYGCNGGLMDNAFSWVQNNGGLTLESDYPYEGTEGRCKLSVDLVEGTEVTGYRDVEGGNDSAFVVALAKQPLSVAIEADERAFQV
ncbi:hypothetical protein VYU27_009911 [Nannochloropsis oceanica]